MSATRFLVWFHLIYFGLVIPLGAIRGRKRIIAQGQTAPNRLRRYTLISLSLAFFGLLSLVVASRIGVNLLPRALPALSAVLVGISMYVVSVTLVLPHWRAAVQQRSQVVDLFTPRIAAEWTGWLVVSLLAGISEEITWRGVQVILLADLTGQYALAAFASAISFTMAHAIQGWRSAIVIIVPSGIECGDRQSPRRSGPSRAGRPTP